MSNHWLNFVSSNLLYNMLVYAKTPPENLKQRLILISKANSDVELQQILMRKCKDDPLFFFNIFLWTYKPKAIWSEWEPEDPNLPFITFPFQDKFITDLIWCIENQKDNATEKSREMWYSWQVLWIAVWWLLFKSWSWLVWSYKEDYVDKQGSMDSSFERMRYMLDRLPKWMKPDDLIAKYCSISSKTLQAEVWWDSWENFGTGGRRKWIFMDEFALWRSDEKAFRKTKDVTNCRIIWGTPEWRFNVYGKIMTNHKDYAHLDIRKCTLRWTDHPLKTLEWYEKQKLQRTKLDMAKEIDISYDDSVTWAVYPDFVNMVKLRDVEYNSDFKTYTTQDFWRDSNALIIWQKDFRTNQLYILKTIRRVNWHIEKFTAFITWKPVQGYNYDRDDMELIEWSDRTINNRYSNHFWDPYNGNAIQTNAIESISQILSRYWIHLTLKTWSTIESRIRESTIALKRVIVNKWETDFIQSMIQSHYPQIKENSQAVMERTKPVHDENSHFRTAFEYTIDNEPKTVPDQHLQQPKVFHNKLTWKFEVVRQRQANLFWLSQR